MVLRLSLVFMMLFALLVGVMPAAAQDADTLGGPKLGEPATIYDSNGEPAGTITVTDILDPYADFDVVNSSPARGFHWVIATVTIAAGNASLPINTSGFVVIDSAGFSSYQGYYYQSSEEATKYPQFTVSELAAGEEVTGSVYFQVFNGETPAIIEYSPTYEQIVVALDQRDAPVAAGDVVDWNATDGSTVGEVSIAGVVDPLEDYDSSYPPQRGFRYVGVAVTFNNTGTRPVQLSAYNFSAIDQEGFTASSAGVYRTPEGVASLPDLPYDPVQPGQTVTGVVSFLLINGATLKDVVFSPTSDRRIRVGEFTRDAEYTAPEIKVVPTVAADPACADVMVWGKDVTNAVAGVTGSFELLDKVSSGDTTITSDQIRGAADDLRAAADAIKAVDTPDAAQAASDQIAGVVETMADQTDLVADAMDAGDAAAVSTAIATVYSTALETTGGAWADILTRCPDLNNI